LWLLIFFLVSNVSICSSQTVAVPDSATAIKIAEPALAKVYGQKKINDELPLKAELANGIWNVSGTLFCPDKNGNRTSRVGACLGGAAFIQIRQTDGKVLQIGHYK
jgi:hypothetical protein